MHHGDEVLQRTSYFGVCPETNGFGAAPHGIIERREETFGRWKNDGGVPEFSNKRLEFLQGTVFRRSMVCVSLMYAVAFAGGRCTVRFTPSKTNPIISFCESKLPSPAASFFAEIGSLPPVCFVTDVGGNTE